MAWHDMAVFVALNFLKVLFCTMLLDASMMQVVSGQGCECLNYTYASPSPLSKKVSMLLLL